MPPHTPTKKAQKASFDLFLISILIRCLPRITYQDAKTTTRCVNPRDLHAAMFCITPLFFSRPQVLRLGVLPDFVWVS